MLEDEFKTLLYRIALALGIAQSHPDPAAYADEVVTAHDLIIANALAPDPVASTQVLTDATEWAPPVILEVPPAPVLAEPIHADPAPAPVDTTVGSVIDPAAPVVETKIYADGLSATGTAPLPDQSPAEQDAATTSTDTATTSSEQPASAEGEAPAAP